MQNYETEKGLIKLLPEVPGVYLFKNSENYPIYIGKAKNLKSRVSSYFLKTKSDKVTKMVLESKLFSFIKVNSEIEALLLEAKLVRDYMPKYNSALKDDKSPLYIVITKEKYPRVLGLRKTNLSSYPVKYVWGPFVEGRSVQKVLKLIRRIFPYATHLPTKRVCIYHQIGLCSPCPSEIENETNLGLRQSKELAYKKILVNIRKFLNGEFSSIKENLTKKMKESSQGENFEEAASFHKQIQMIERVTSQNQTSVYEYVSDPSFLEEKRKTEMDEFQKLLSPFFKFKNFSRIECFDNAHLDGSSPTASMVTFVDGDVDKSLYRHFKIKKSPGNSDFEMMKEVMTRRRNNLEKWGTPDLIIVDGGKPQVTAAVEVWGDELPIVGLAKRFETIVVKQNEKFIEIRMKPGPALYLVQRLRDEAHRFARRLHHKQVSKNLLS